MKRTQLVILVAASLPLVAVHGQKMQRTFTPGARILVNAHNAYPDHGKYEDRLDRALLSVNKGIPVILEEDLTWIDGKSLLIHGNKAVGTNDPTIDSYFFTKLKPVMEKAMTDGNKGNWPLVTLYLDFKSDPVEHLEYFSKVLDTYNSWLTTAIKTSDIKKQSPLDMKPMIVIVEDKQNDIKQKFFYDRLPEGGKIRVFGSVTKPDQNPGKKMSKQEAIDKMVLMDPEQIVTAKADNYHRWWGSDWAFIEKGGQTVAGDWTKEEETRLKKWVDYGHRLGYLMGFYCLNGYTAAEDQGWDKGYNFGSKAAVMDRWKASVRAHLDFISTDQYEDLTEVINGK